MSRAKEYKQINIDVEPFLSIMAIVLKLISLILVVIVMRIAVNPKLKKIIALQGLWDKGKGNITDSKSPSYLDCWEDKVVIWPGNKTVTWEDVQRPDNAVEVLLDKIQKNATNEYVVVLVRPKSVKLYRTVRKMIQKHPIDVGLDAVDMDFNVAWDEARKGLGVALDDDKPAAVGQKPKSDKNDSKKSEPATKDAGKPEPKKN